MKKASFIILALLVLAVLGLIFFNFYSIINKGKGRPLVNNSNNKMGRILMVLAFRDFRDEEYFVPREILMNAGYFIDTCSSQKGVAVGVSGGEAEVNYVPEEIDALNYEAIVFVGGPGMAKELDNTRFQNLAKDFYASHKLIGAICIAPALLAKAGILKDKNATVWTSDLDKSAIKILEENGSHYQNKTVVIDGNIITANGPEAAEEFGRLLVDYGSKNF